MSSRAEHTERRRKGMPTDAQLIILTLLARGNSRAEVAQIIGAAEDTVKNHLTAAYNRLNAANGTHAVVMCMERGWIPVRVADAPKETTHA